ncbi:type II toxin-antitoxin system Phd/YefM family antitoxin [Enterovirga sp. CN4-39]|uniref:type II toxin-antitoxin system Phd/YefM family antitoxin n=1 Tax=Enterovirga sp. CN4-39 TaxID=3400910 RepID=UPI003C0E4D31
MRTVSAADASRHFSKILREVKDGETVVITSHGEPVAKLEPLADAEADKVRREEAWRDLLDHLRTRPALNLGKFNRDELYDDD